MDKQEFITRLMTKYMHYFKEENAKVWRDDYLKVLDGDIDFEYLYKLFNKEYESVKLPPSAAYIKSLAQRSLNVSQDDSTAYCSNKYRPIEIVPFDNVCSEYAAKVKDLMRKKIAKIITVIEFNKQMDELRTGLLKITDEAS